jgi:tRNA dimethylallyltransferase
LDDCFDFFVVAGATASGKTALAIRLAERFGCELIGADAFQIYCGLDLLTAKPSRQELARVPHHLVGEVPLAERMDAARYARLARACVDAVKVRGRIPLVVGGTGLYIRALAYGMPDAPPADPVLRNELEQLPIEVLLDELNARDPVSAAVIDRANPRRVIRAVEVCRLAGRPFSSFKTEPVPPRVPFGVVLRWERGALHQRIEARTRAMFAAGVIAEVAAASESGPTAAQAIGFREIRQLLAGEISEERCRELIVAATRQYAKRQETWFGKEPGLTPVAVGEESADPFSEACEQLECWLAARVKAGELKSGRDAQT